MQNSLNFISFFPPLLFDSHSTCTFIHLLCPVLPQILQAEATSASRPQVQKPLVEAEAKGALVLPAYFQLRGDLVDGLHFAQKDSVFSRNLKKAIAAVFQVQGKAGTRTEAR